MSLFHFEEGKSKWGVLDPYLRETIPVEFIFFSFDLSLEWCCRIIIFGIAIPYWLIYVVDEDDFNYPYPGGPGFTYVLYCPVWLLSIGDITHDYLKIYSMMIGLTFFLYWTMFRKDNASSDQMD